MIVKPKILIVDDKPENLKAFRIVLQDLNIEIIEATSGNAALKKTLHHDFALALLDIQMPGMDGYELAEILREEEKTAQLPFIFVSAVYEDNLNVFKGFEKGAFGFITKPFQSEVLINKVKFFIDKHHQEIALITLNEELNYLNKELEAFTYSVSHDLRAPLRAVNGYLQILKEDYDSKLDDEGKRIIETINYNAKKMESLINDLLAFSKLGRKEIRKTDIDMNILVESVMIEINNSMTHAAKIEFGSLHKVTADYDLLYQVIFNLISNAIKYSSKKENPVVEIFSEENHHETIFSVKDNGAGFDMKYVGKLFGVFQRLHSQEDFHGTGVGLAIVQKIIAKHKGKVWAEGKVNEGAVFNFSLVRN